MTDAALMPDHANRGSDAGPTETWLSVHDVGALLGRSARTVRRWIAAGDLPALRIRGTTRVPMSALAAQTKR